MKTKLFFIYLTLSLFTIYAQELDPVNLQNITPKSPEASNLGQYGQIDVGLYTGKPNISIPLHIVKSGNLQFPINLYYDATGIRVNQEATWVGLGWELSTIAAITYVPAGGNDQETNFMNSETGTTVLPWQKYEDFIDYIQGGLNVPSFGHEDGYAGWNNCSYVPSPLPQYTDEQIIHLAENGYAQVDYYQVSCPGLSFNFYIHPGTGEFKMLGEKYKYKIERITNSSGFIITTPKGVKYTFNAVEDYNYSLYKNAWFLTEIRNSNNDDFISFNYTSYGPLNPIQSFSEYILSGFQPDYGMPNINTFHRLVRGGTNIDALQPLYLSSIQTNIETVTFNTDSIRDDLDGVGKRKLNSIDISSSYSNYQKSFEFNYSYFDYTNVGGDYYQEDVFHPNFITPTYFKKRLKLLSITEKNGAKEKTHSFEYNETPLPYKTSFAKDYWGFYNGEDNDTFIPNLSAVLAMDTGLRNMYENNFAIFKDHFGGDFQLNDKAIRGASKEHMKAGVLTAINYPTGGKTQFDYEPHTFGDIILSANEEASIGGGQYIHSAYLCGGGASQNSVSFTLTQETLVTFDGMISNLSQYGYNYSCTDMAGTKIRLFGPNGSSMTTYLEFDCASFQNGETHQTGQQDVLLPAGTYVIILNSGITAQNSWEWYVSCTFRYSYIDYNSVLNNHTTSFGGGLRIKEITNLDTNGGFISKKTYSYDGGSLKKKIKMVVTDNFTRCVNPAYSGGGDGVSKRHSEPISTISASPLAAVVGYSKVTEKMVNSNATDNTGRIESYFQNTTPVQFFDFYTYTGADLRNGKIDSVIIYNKSNLKVKQENFTYTQYDYDVNSVNIYAEDTYHGATLCTQNTGGINPPNTDMCAFIGRYKLFVYPYLAYKYLLTEKTTIDYINTENLINITSTAYNLTNYLPNNIQSTNSLNEVVSTEYTYPSDYNSEPYLTMANTLNWISPIIEQTTKNNGVEISSSKVDYATLSNGIVPKFVYTKKGTNNFVLEKNITYDINNNPIQIAEKDGTFSEIIWGFNNTLPIVIGKNSNGTFNTTITSALPTGYATLEDLVTSLDDIAENSSQQTLWNSFNTNLRNLSSNSSIFITTYTYDPLLGVTSITDERGYTSYYVYDELGRLQYIKDQDNHILSENEYNYQN